MLRAIPPFQRLRALLRSRKLHVDPTKSAVKSLVEKPDHNVIFSKPFCPSSERTKVLFEDLEVSFDDVELDDSKEGVKVQKILEDITGREAIPSVFIKGKYIGGYEEAIDMYSKGELKDKAI